MFIQDLEICDAKGRDCIEENSSKTFHCNTTCAGIYADAQWVGKNVENDLKDEVEVEGDETMKVDLKEKIEEKWIERNSKRIFLLLEREMNIMINKMNLMKQEMSHMKIEE